MTLFEECRTARETQAAALERARAGRPDPLPIIGVGTRVELLTTCGWEGMTIYRVRPSNHLRRTSCYYANATGIAADTMKSGCHCFDGEWLRNNWGFWRIVGRDVA
jgi:hypothetical protein